MKIKVTLTNGKVKEYQAGTTLAEVARDENPDLARMVLAAQINDNQVVDLNYPLEQDTKVRFLTFEDEEGKQVFRHSAAHVLAQAVKRLYPQTKLAIGPAIKDGFYYDFDTFQKFTPEELEKIEQEIGNIIKDDLPFTRTELAREEALVKFDEVKEDYKIELINDLTNTPVVSLYTQGEFTDLCAGPHIPSTGKLRAVKLTGVAGAYWRGDEKNKMLQRIYGTAFPSPAQLEEYLFRQEEAKRRDHRRLGVELDLFSFHEEGPGFPFFHPAGMVLYNQLVQFWREEHKKQGYQEIKTPLILSQDLWEQSGHWEHYRENMYFTKVDEKDFAVKPMNCPGSMLIYRSRLHSYRDLPVRLAELGLVHRHELSGVLHGLMRLRCFTQDDAHLYMLPDQVGKEIIGVINMVEQFYQTFGFKYRVELSTKPEKAMGSDEIWEMATRALQDALEAKGMTYKVNAGDGAFYGPKIDFHLEDSLGRSWQCGTIQLDFLMPEKFDLFYIGGDGQKHRPVMVHRVIFGSIERFIGILIEHYAGNLPLWLSPVQVKVLPIADRHVVYAEEVTANLAKEQIRAELDTRREKINYKIREAQLRKIPYMLVIGDKEAANKTVALRTPLQGDQGPVPLPPLVQIIKQKIENKAL
ncbi:MAG TPA: threonine--tRNA ligase [Desulfotomaculum sp.]|nr:threonine--tRNA ligase [Desulfotomaculum sp.]